MHTTQTQNACRDDVPLPSYPIHTPIDASNFCITKLPPNPTTAGAIRLPPRTRNLKHLQQPRHHSLHIHSHKRHPLIAPLLHNRHER